MQINKPFFYLKFVFINLLLITALTQNVFAQTFNKVGLDKYFETLAKRKWFMGSVAISKNGTILYTKQVGFADVTNKIVPNIKTKYRIGSISKTFTAVLIFKAIEESKLKLTDNIYSYFPTLKNAKKITISNLLNHRSGIHNLTESENFSDWGFEKRSREELLEIIVAGGSDFEPDSKSYYSNSNYILLSMILEKIYKIGYEQILKDKITAPLNLTNTYFGSPNNPKERECNSYYIEKTWVKYNEKTDVSMCLGAGGVVSSPSDLTQFANALFKGELVSYQNLELMKTIKDNCGMGLFKIPFDTKFGYGHNGSIDGFYSEFLHFDDNNISIAITCNGLNYNFSEVSKAMLSAVYNLPLPNPDKILTKHPNTDCNTAIEVNDSIVGPINVSRGFGSIRETGLLNKCQLCDESNSIWLKYTVERDTTLMFDIVPIDARDDYDFVLYKAEGSDCNNQKKIIRTCFSVCYAKNGMTGLSNYSTITETGTGLGPGYVSAVYVKAGETYYLLVTMAEHYMVDRPAPLGFMIYFYNYFPKKKLRNIKNIQFESDKADIKPESITELDKLVYYLQKYPIKIEVRGYSDNSGNKEKNQLLSEERAKAVLNYLIKKQIKPSRLFYKGMGSANPIGNNNTEEGRAKNRRVEFVIIYN